MRQVNPHTREEIRICFITRFMPSRISLFIWLTSAAAQPLTSVLAGRTRGGSRVDTGGEGVVCGGTGRRSDVTPCQKFTGELT